ncbi:MAG: DMT family transporter [Paracoccaceae bacterium]
MRVNKSEASPEIARPVGRATARDWIFLLLLGAIWGGAFMWTKIATEGFAPLSLAGLRLSIGALALTGLLLAQGSRWPGLATPAGRRFWLFALAVGFLANAMPFTALAWAQRHIDSALAGVFMATVPLFVLPLAHAFVPGERMTLRKVAGFLLGFTGILVLIGPGALSALGAGGSLALAAQGACLLTAFGYASGSIASKRAPEFGPLPFAAASLVFAALMTLPLAIAFEDPFGGAPGLLPTAAVIYLGLVPTGVAMVMLLQVIQSAGPSFLALVNYQVPIWAVIFGAAVLGEAPSPRLGLALVLILAGLAIAQNLLGLRRGGHARG